MIFESLMRFFTKRKDEGKATDTPCELFEREAYHLYIKELAIHTAVNLVASTLTQGELLTFEKGEQVKKNNYYLFNVAPNQNESATAFWRKVVFKMLLENEALVVMKSGRLYCCDSFTRKTRGFKETRYFKPTVDGSIFADSVGEKDVLYFPLHDRNMKAIIDGLCADYGELLSYSKDNYKRANARRGVLNIPATYPQTEEKIKE